VAGAGGVKTTENKVHCPLLYALIQATFSFLKIFFKVLHFINQAFLSEITAKSKNQIFSTKMKRIEYPESKEQRKICNNFLINCAK
jgi:hypothetical protein